MSKGNKHLQTQTSQNQSQSQSQQAAKKPAVSHRPQHGLPASAFFGTYPGRGPPSAAYNDMNNRPPQRFAGYGPPHLNPHQSHPPSQPFSAQTHDIMHNRDERDNRFERNASAFPRPRASSYVHYSQQLQPPVYAQPGGPPPPHVAHSNQAAHGEGRFDSHPASQGPGSPPQLPPTYGPTYSIVRSQSWANSERPFHIGGPYTSAQQRNNSEGRIDAETQNDEVGSFSMHGSNGQTPPIPQQSQLTKKHSYGYNQIQQVHSAALPQAVDADAMAYKAVEGRDGATSPSQIDSNRRDDVSIMGCTCKKTKCLKLYCVCFGASVMCGASCRCLNCHNTPSHEHSRKDAIRSILARNPSAFDTKFKKTPEARAVHVAPEKAIAHKLGCKCRKSFCMKKYCECYNAGVKCSGNCRCVSCKNMPPGGFGNDTSDSAIALRSFAADVNRVKGTIATAGELPPNTEIKMRDAATHLAFLKHSSPARSITRPCFEGNRAISSSIPSLADSSSGTMSSSPDEVPTEKLSLTPSKATIGVDSLLMAAYAMTELHEAASAPSTPQQRKESGQFKSPKRKSHSTPLQDQFEDADDVDCSDESDGVDSEIDGTKMMTPNSMRHVKRTRLGTVERKVPTSTRASHDTLDTKLRPEKPPSDSEEDELSPDDDNNQPSPEESMKVTTATTPQTSTKPSNMGGLTPVTARCIDFQHMGVTEAVDIDDKKEDDMVTT